MLLNYKTIRTIFLAVFSIVVGMPIQASAQTLSPHDIKMFAFYDPYRRAFEEFQKQVDVASKDVSIEEMPRLSNEFGAKWIPVLTDKKIIAFLSDDPKMLLLLHLNLEQVAMGYARFPEIQSDGNSLPSQIKKKNNFQNFADELTHIVPFALDCDGQLFDTLNRPDAEQSNPELWGTGRVLITQIRDQLAYTMKNIFVLVDKDDFPAELRLTMLKNFADNAMSFAAAMTLEQRQEVLKTLTSKKPDANKDVREMVNQMVAALSGKSCIGVCKLSSSE